MVCKEILGLVRNPPRDISDEEIEAIFDWHATRCPTCRSRYKALGPTSGSEAIFEWFSERAHLIASAREKMWRDHDEQAAKKAAE